MGGQTRSWEDEIMDQLGGVGVDDGANASVSAPKSSFSILIPSSLNHPAQPAVNPHPVSSAQPTVNLNFPNQPMITMNLLSVTGAARAPADIPSISGSRNWTQAHAAIPNTGPVQAQNTSDVHIPFANLLLTNGQSSQPSGSAPATLNINTIPTAAIPEPVVILALVSVPSNKASWSKKGKKSDHVQMSTEEVVPGRATWSKAKQP
ncbi:hypothetical protein JVT61DRAFT_10311 [Boletus reticuloceps]|uniref:Uncharacterized protein n=1 Tax=Boletus reticuloceps TaxID=495285 RepID=A0A8I2YUY8_9AGAM|nr:hypothetical protein JVT61DRAFT_10311 [Boletus reticuloceps]